MDRRAHLDELLQKRISKRYKFLPGPADSRKIAAARRKLDPEIPDALLELYAWRDGSSSLPIFGDYVFVPVSELAKHRKRLLAGFRQRAEILHDAPWIPFLYDYTRERYLCLDTAGMFGGREGQIISAGLWEDSIDIVFTSLSAWLDAFIALMEDGVDPERPSKAGPKRAAWARDFAAVRRRLGHSPPRRVNPGAESLRARVENDGSSAKTMLLKAAIDNKRGEMREATLEALRKRIVPPAEGASIALELARALLREAEREAAKAAKGKQTGKSKRPAEEAFDARVDVWEDACDALLAAVHLHPDLTNEAVSRFEDAIASSTTPGERFYLHFKLGYFYDTAGDAERALESYRRSVAFFDQMTARLKRVGHNYAHNNLGVLLEQSGHYEEAIAMYRRAIEVSPRDGIPRKGLADALSRMGRWAEALPEYRRAAKSSSSWLGAWTALITCCKRLGLDAEAESALIKAHALAEEGDAPLVEHACLSSVAGDTDAALEMLRASIELDPSLRRVMRHDLDFEHLWSDPRFLELVS